MVVLNFLWSKNASVERTHCSHKPTELQNCFVNYNTYCYMPQQCRPVHSSLHHAVSRIQAGPGRSLGSTGQRRNRSSKVGDKRVGSVRVSPPYRGRGWIFHLSDNHICLLGEGYPDFRVPIVILSTTIGILGITHEFILKSMYFRTIWMSVGRKRCTERTILC